MCLKNALRKMCVQFPATNKLPYHTPNVNYIPDRYSQEISLTCLKNNNFFISEKNLDGFFQQKGVLYLTDITILHIVNLVFL